MQNRMLTALCGLVMMGMAGTAQAVSVDLELSLVIDSSGSISNSQFNQQIGGYSAAFRQADVIDSIVNSTNGIAVNTILFASVADEVLGFRRLRTAQDVADFADDLDGVNRIGGATNIAGGINLAVETANTNNFETGNVIIDVSGDGLENIGSAAAARDAALSAGVTRINAIAVGSASLLNFFETNVIGGTGAFALRADSFDDFDTAIANKLGIELGITPQPPQDPVGVPEPGAIGLIGLGFLALGFAMRRRRSV